MPNIKTAVWSWRWRQIGCLLQQEKAKRVRFNFVLDPAFFSAPESSFLGIFFVLPCIESYQKVDLRTITLDVPPQEVKMLEGWRVKTFLKNTTAKIRDGVYAECWREKSRDSNLTGCHFHHLIFCFCYIRTITSWNLWLTYSILNLKFIVIILWLQYHDFKCYSLMWPQLYSFHCQKHFSSLFKRPNI